MPVHRDDTRIGFKPSVADGERAAIEFRGQTRLGMSFLDRNDLRSGHHSDAHQERSYEKLIFYYCQSLLSPLSDIETPPIREVWHRV